MKNTVFITILLLSCLYGPYTLAADPDGDGVDDTLDVDDDGDGLIEIRTLQELNNIRNNLGGTAYNNGSGDNRTGCGNGVTLSTCSGYELANHLDFDTNSDGVINANDAWWNAGAGWLPIGLTFAGTFEGNGFQIRNLYINDTLNTSTGLFAATNNGAEIRNTGLTGALMSVSGTGSAVGGLVGNVGSGTTITNCYVTGPVTASNFGSVGGLAGSVFSSSISNSYSTGAVSTGESGYAGGLAGDVENSSISASYATGPVNGGISSGGGGLVGKFASTSAGSINTSYATGPVSVAAGILAAAGGLVGESSGSNSAITNSYATGSATTGGTLSAVGGLVGAAFNANITNSYATGAVTATNNNGTRGGLVGGESANTVGNSYWDTNSTGQLSSYGGTGKTTAQLQCPTAFNTNCASGGQPYLSWNNTIWDFGIDSQYPALIVNGVVRRDTDADGLFDGADEDGDGLPNAYETANGLNPLVADATQDPDSDGLNNTTEYQIGTDPKNADTDGDGLADGAESGEGRDPLVNEAAVILLLLE